jgi:hypothetical protein
MVSALALHQLMVGKWWDGLVGVFDASSAVLDPVAYMDAAAATHRPVSSTSSGCSLLCSCAPARWPSTSAAARALIWAR